MRASGFGLLASGFALAALVLVAAPTTVLSQVPPGGGAGGGPTPGGGGPGGGTGGAGIPSAKEIEKRIKEYLDSRPENTAEWSRFKITYKAIETDPVELLKNSGQLPPGVDADKAAKQYLPLARPYIEKYMNEIGKLIADVDFKYKSQKIVAAEYAFGLEMRELTPVAIRLTGKSLKAPLLIPLSGKAAQSPFATLNIVLKEGKKEGEFLADVGWAKILATSPKLVVVK